jgi:NAD(P)-dependent dehydrogenase (short-subunit alcohol dehydrogenase family)
VLAVALDVTNPEQVTSAVRQAEKRFGGVDVLVNNAGYGYRAAVEEGDDADIRALLETHFLGTVAMIKAVLPGMRARRSGAIVNISSIGAQLTPMGSGYYSAAKAAIEGMSGALRDELVPLGISVTVVEPGAFRTDFAGRSLASRHGSSTTTPTLPGSAAKNTTPCTARSPATPPKPEPRSSRPSNRASPPAFLLLGADALAAYRCVADARANEIAKWEQLLPALTSTPNTAAGCSTDQRVLDDP